MDGRPIGHRVFRKAPPSERGHTGPPDMQSRELARRDRMQALVKEMKERDAEEPE
jgi:hypothetical protein